MDGLIGFLFEALRWLGEMLLTVGQFLLDGIMYVIKGFFWLFLSGVLSTFSGFIKLIDFGALTIQWAAAKSSIPSMGLYVMQAVAFGEIVTMIAVAYMIRLTLNLIPSWATRA